MVVRVTMISPVDLATVDSVVNTVVQHVARSLRRQGHRGGLGDSRGLREVVRQHVLMLANEPVEPDIATLISVAFEAVPEWALLAKAGVPT